MRLIFGTRNVLYFVRILQSFARITDEVRIVSSADSIRIEAVKDPVAFGSITVSRIFFDAFSEEEPIDVIFKSRSILLVFRNAVYLGKKLLRFDVTIQRDEDYAVFRQTMQMYERISHIPFQNRLHVAELNFGDYESYPAKLKCPVKLLSDGMRYFPGTIQLVTFRIRDADVKVETGDEEADAEYMTKFKFWKEEFEYHTRSEDVTVTFSLKLLKQFLSAWDKKNHDIECYFKEGNGIVFTTTISGVKTRLMLASVIKDHAPNSPVPTGDETINSTNVTYFTENMSHVNVSIGNLTVSNQANAGPDLSLDQSAVSADQSIGVNQQPVQEEEEEMFDDSLDELISHIPDPVTPPAEPTPGTSGLNRSNAFGATQQSSQESFDPYVYRDLLDDRVFARSRKIAGLDDTLPIIGRRFGGGGDDESDDESEGFLFDD